MTRLFALPALLVALVVGGYLYTKNMQTNGPTSPTVAQDINQAQSSVAATNVRGADVSLQAWYEQNGTYAGAALAPGPGVSLVRADATSYCLQATAADGSVEHENGPGGQAQPGSC
jgi:hypothetical protein